MLEGKSLKIVSLYMLSAILGSILTVILVDRHSITEHKLGDIQIFVKENKITGSRCTISEGLVAKLGSDVLASYGFPSWC